MKRIKKIKKKNWNKIMIERRERERERRFGKR
jgi:hypothetical protein